MKAIVLGAVIMLAANGAWAESDCRVDGEQSVSSESIVYKVVYNDQTVQRKAVYTAKVYIKRCEIGSASPVDDRFCTWKHDVYVIRDVYEIVRGGKTAGPLENWTKRINVSSTDHQPETKVRVDGSEKNCNSQRQNAEKVDDQMRQLASESLANVISSDRDSITGQEKRDDPGFVRVDW